MLSGKRILLTGGCGFIGSHLVLRLCQDNEVLVVDNHRRDALRFQDQPEDAKFELYDRDITEKGALDDLLEGVDWVIHLAAVAGVSNYIKHPATTLTNNLIGTWRVLEALRSRQISRFLNFSTSEVYGAMAVDASERMPTVQGPIGEARWSYAVSKTAAEHLCFAYHREYGVPTVSVRPFNIFGPAQVGEGAIHDIALRALQNQQVHITGDGQQVRTWCYIEDMIEATELLLTHPAAVGRVYNVGNARPVVKMLDLANMIIELADSSSEITFRPHAEVDVRLRSPNVNRIHEQLGFRPKVSLEDGLRRTINWYRDHLVEMLECHE